LFDRPKPTAGCSVNGRRRRRRKSFGLGRLNPVKEPSGTIEWGEFYIRSEVLEKRQSLAPARNRIRNTNEVRSSDVLRYDLHMK
jgi:hypothetical protein